LPGYHRPATCSRSEPRYTDHHRDGHCHTDLYQYANAYPNSDSYLDLYPDDYSYAYRHSNSQYYIHLDSNTYAQPHTDSQRHQYLHLDIDPYVHTKCNIDTNADLYFYTNSHY
jgi:hypothetical protein